MKDFKSHNEKVEKAIAKIRESELRLSESIDKLVSLCNNAFYQNNPELCTPQKGAGDEDEH